jgi:hypothetical protein
VRPWNYRCDVLRETGECVLAIPSAELAQQVVDVGNISGATADKWTRFGLGPDRVDLRGCAAGGGNVSRDVSFSDRVTADRGEFPAPKARSGRLVSCDRGT